MKGWLLPALAGLVCGVLSGLGIGGGTPYYVVGLDAERNEVIVGFKEASVRYDIELTDSVGEIDKSLPVKVRSALSIIHIRRCRRSG